MSIKFHDYNHVIISSYLKNRDGPKLLWHWSAWQDHRSTVSERNELQSAWKCLPDSGHWLTCFFFHYFPLFITNVIQVIYSKPLICYLLSVLKTSSYICSLILKTKKTRRIQNLITSERDPRMVISIQRYCAFSGKMRHF